MKKNSVQKVVLGTATLLAAGAASQPANAATTGVPIEAIILAPVQITQNQSLNFGSLTEAGAGTAVVAHTGGITPSANITSIGGTIQNAKFTLKATIAKAITVTAPATVKITETAAGIAKMTVGSFTIEGGASPYTHTMVASTDTGHRMGATLTIGAGQTTGTYQGTVTLTANYQ